MKTKTLQEALERTSDYYVSQLTLWECNIGGPTFLVGIVNQSLKSRTVQGLIELLTGLNQYE